MFCPRDSPSSAPIFLKIRNYKNELRREKTSIAYEQQKFRQASAVLPEPVLFAQVSVGSGETGLARGQEYTERLIS